MPLTPGTRIGVFEITSPLGVGGMGEVYRARDTRLNRDVAIKVLPDAFAADVDRLARFEREAQTLGALNHPNIAQIYGVEELDTGRALVMELVEGETLAERIARGPIPADEAVQIARQMAEALETAHEAGIIHRDLKPANIRLRPDGGVKVLDFGLAKTFEPAGAADRRHVASSPTFTSPAMTEAGIILGTASYMSPEQARGRGVDRRADIWAFGCVLFEMLTARTLFAGESITETLARVIERDPDLSPLPASTSPVVRRVLARCLVRDPRQRLRDIGEARVMLEQPSTAITQEPALAPGRRRGALALLIIATAAVASAATLWLVRAPDAATVPEERRFAVAVPGNATPVDVSISPDGRSMLTIAAGKLWLQRLDRFGVTEVPGSDDARAPFWSLDGADFGFEVRGQLWRGTADGAAPARIGAVPDFGLSSSVVWLRDDRLVFTTGGTGLLQVPATGGEARPLFELDPAKELDIHDVAAVAGGEALLYVVHTISRPWTIEMFAVSDGSRRTLYSAAGVTGLARPVYLSGHVLFQQASGIWAAPFSVREQRLTADPFLVLADARMPAVSSDGTLVMLSGAVGEGESSLAWVDRAGKVTRTIADPRVMLFDPRVSPDGRRAVAARGPRADADLWIFDLERGSERRLSFEIGPDVQPVWSRDGQHIVYQCSGTICARRADGAGSRVELLDGPALAPSLSPDGRLLAFVREVQPGDRDIFVVELGPDGLKRKATAKPRLLVSGPRMQMVPQISPDGRHVAYVSMERFRMSTFVAQFPSGDGKWEVPLSETNTMPRWSLKGDRLFVVDDQDRIVELPVDRSRGVEIGAPLTRISANALNNGGYDRSADGTQFLVPVLSTSGPNAGRLLVVQNWSPLAR
jgi:serine/threonine-protein kinase